jgi:hypothetical protein
MTANGSTTISPLLSTPFDIPLQSRRFSHHTTLWHNPVKGEFHEKAEARVDDIYRFLRRLRCSRHHLATAILNFAVCPPAATSHT